MKSFIALSCLASVALSESVGDKGTATGRCHIFYAGDYGACDSFQVSQADTTGPCGDSVSNPCISTFHPDMSAGGMTNCNNCYKLTINYKDGVSLCTYVKAVDTDASDCKYEMSQVAWGKICPVICQDDGLCAHSADQCKEGLIPDDPAWTAIGVPESCAAQSYPITWEVVDCNGGASGCSSGSGPAPPGPPTPVQPTQAPYPPPVQPTQAPYPPPVQPTRAPYPPPVQPTQAPYPPPVQPTQAPYPPPVQPTQAPYPPPAPTGACYVPNSWEWKSAWCVACPDPQATSMGSQCPTYQWAGCYTSLANCCADCISQGYCNPSKCK